MAFSYTGSTDSYDHNGRPDSHLNLSCLAAMVAELRVKTRNPVEEQILALATFGKTDLDVARILKNGYLRQNGVNVCHKMPIEAFQISLCACMNSARTTAVSASPWKELVELYGQVRSTGTSSPSSDIVALQLAVSQAGKQHEACTLAWNICTAYDSSPNNLYFGYATTNSSIGNNSDLHYDVSSSSPAPSPPTPRGPSMENSLNALQQFLGLPTTSSITAMDLSDEWTMNSGVLGRKSEGTGYVLTKQ